MFELENDLAVDGDYVLLLRLVLFLLFYWFRVKDFTCLFKVYICEFFFDS